MAATPSPQNIIQFSFYGGQCQNILLVENLNFLSVYCSRISFFFFFLNQIIINFEAAMKLFAYKYFSAADGVTVHYCPEVGILCIGLFALSC